MKKSLVFLTAAVLTFVVISAFGDYWPDSPTKMPLNLGAKYGMNAYVVGANKAAVSGSIAISDDASVAYVKDAVNATQIGGGANTTPNSIKYRDNYVAQILVDSGTNATTTTSFSAPHAGALLVGLFGVGTNGVWVAGATGTNGWVQIAP